MGISNSAPSHENIIFIIGERFTFRFDSSIKVKTLLAQQAIGQNPIFGGGNALFTG
jgi:hypothetical protein